MGNWLIIDDSQIKELQKGLEELPSALNKATSRAISRSVDVMRTAAWDAIKDTYNIKQGDVYRYMQKIKNPMDGGILVTAPHIPISAFPMYPPQPQSYPAMPQPQLGSQPTVAFAIKKGDPESIEGAFVAVMKSGHVGLFIKRGATQYPIDQQFTIGVAEMVGSLKVREAVKREAVETFEAEFKRQSDMALKKALDHAK